MDCGVNVFTKACVKHLAMSVVKDWDDTYFKRTKSSVAMHELIPSDRGIQIKRTFERLKV